MQVKLKVLVGADAGKEIYVKQEEFYVGRSDDCQLRAKNQWVSRRHCVFVQENGRVLLADLKSRNGTFVNSVRLESEKAKSLNSGDRIRIGQLDFEIEIEFGIESAKKPEVGSVAEATSRIAAASTNNSYLSKPRVDSWGNGPDTLDRDDLCVSFPNTMGFPDSARSMLEDDSFPTISVDSFFRDSDALVGIAVSGNGWESEFPRILQLITISHVHYPYSDADTCSGISQPSSAFRKAVASEFDFVGVFDCQSGCVNERPFDLGVFLQFHVRDSLSSLLGLKLGPEYNQEQISQMLEDFGDRTCLWCFMHAELLSANDLQHLREFTQSLNRVLFCGPNHMLDQKCEAKTRRQDKKGLMKLPKLKQFTSSTKNSKDAASAALKK